MMEVEFLTESQDYSVAEFYEKFHTQLPVVVQVNQGFQGHIIEDTFGKGEILYIAAISKQERVVAKVHTGKCFRVLSIPKAFNENLCIIKHGKPGHEHSLSEILKHHRLPLKAQYPPNEIIIMGNKCFSSNEMPHMELVKTFEEIYLLGNYLTDGRLGKHVLPVPLYLPQLRLCRVTGIKRLTDLGWIKHCDTLKEESRRMKYDLRFGNRYVAEYDPASIRPRMKYAYAKPLVYDTVINLMMHWPEFHFGLSPGKSADPETRDELHAKTKTEQNNDKVKMSSKQQDLAKGKLGKDIIHVPLYLSQLRLCRITGIRHLKEAGWRKHCNALEEESRQMEYDLLFGNRYVAEYDPESIHPSTNYAYAEPLKYDTFINLMMHWPECHFGRSSSRSFTHGTRDESHVNTMTEQMHDLETEHAVNVNTESESSHFESSQKDETEAN